jgi:CheY-like chemotaxis protein
VVADPTQLSRAFGYVLRNALEAMTGREKQHITVNVAPTGDGRFVAVQISDTGPGIPEEDLDKIWAAFYTTKGAKHAGLGLSACAQILKQADGKASAATAPTGGAVFELQIPVYDGPRPAVNLPSEKTFLLVDDDDAWSRFVEQALAAAGSRVVRSAVEHVDLGEFDLILVDDVLESSDTQAVLRRLRDAGVGDKTVVVASSLRVERTMELMPFGVRDVVLKAYTPFMLAELLS